MRGQYVIIAAFAGLVGASTMALAASEPMHHHVRHHVAAATADNPPLQPENAPPVSSAWSLPQGWPHTP